jgi:hypothetical protein
MTEPPGNSDNTNWRGAKQQRMRFIPAVFGFFSFAFPSTALARFRSQSRAADGDCWQRWRFNKTS